MEFCLVPPRGPHVKSGNSESSDVPPGLRSGDPSASFSCWLRTFFPKFLLSKNCISSLINTPRNRLRPPVPLPQIIGERPTGFRNWISSWWKWMEWPVPNRSISQARHDDSRPSQTGAIPRGHGFRSILSRFHTGHRATSTSGHLG